MTTDTHSLSPEQLEQVRALAGSEDSYAALLEIFDAQAEQLEEACQQKLTQDTALLNTIVQAQQAIIWSIDADGKFVTADGQGLVALGMQPDQIVGLSVFDMYESFPEVIESIKKALAGEPQTVDSQMGPLHFENLFQPVVAEDGTVTGVVGFALDITQRAELENTLRQKEAELSKETAVINTIVQAQRAIVWSIDADGKFVYADGKGLTALGTQPENLIGQSVFDMYESFPDVVDAIRKALDGTPQSIDSQMGPFAFENLFQPLVGEDGAITGVVGFALDVTERAKLEQALRDSQILLQRDAALLKAITQSPEAIMFATDKEGTFTYSRGNGLKKLGLEADQVVGASLFEMYKDFPEIIDYTNQALNEGKNAAFTQEVANIVFETLYEPIIDDQGEIQGVVGFSFDVTQRAELEKSLRESQIQLQRDANLLNAITQSPDVIMYAIDKQGIFTYSRGKGLAKLGLEPDQFKGLDLYQVYKEAPPILEATDKVLKGESVGYSTEVEGLRFETLYEPIIDENDEVVGAVGFSIDTTQQAKLQEELRRNQNLMQLVLDNIPQNVFWKDRQGHYLGANQAFAEIAGKSSPDELIGLDDHDLPWAKEETEFFIEVDQTVMGNDEPQINIVEPQTQSDGNIAWLRTNKFPLHDQDGEVFGILGTFEDITEEMMAQNAIKARNERRVIHLELGQELADKLGQLDDIPTTYAQFVDTIVSRLNYDYAQLLLANSAQERLEIAYGSGDLGQKLYLEGFSIPYTEGAAGQAVTQQETVIQTDIAEHERIKHPLLSGMANRVALPIFMNGKLMGVFDIFREKDTPFIQDDALVLSSLVNLFALSLESFTARQEMNSQLEELNSLQKLMSVEGWENFQASNMGHNSGYIFSNNNVLPMRDDAEDEAQGNEALMTTVTGRIVTKPISVRGATIGALGIQDNPNQPLGKDEQELLDAISLQLAEALENARLLQQTQKRAVELETVARVSAATSTILKTEQLLQSMVDLTKRSFNLYHAHTYIYNNHEDVLRLVAGAGEVGEIMVAEGWQIPLSREGSLVARAARDGEAVIVSDVRLEPNYLPNKLLPDTRSELVIPMVVGDRLIGVLDLQSQYTNFFNRDDVKIYNTLAQQIAIAIQNARLYEEQLETSEKLREVDMMKSEFLASMSHELRTPLNSIIGFADVLLEGIDGELNEFMREDVRLIRDSGQHLRDLIGDILDMSKIEAGMMDLNFVPVDLTQIANDVSAMIQGMLQDKPVEMITTLGEDIDNIEVDKTRFVQILFNLLSNAAKFTDEGEIEMSMVRQKDHLLVSVRDTGVGIKEEEISQVFEQFRQIGGLENRKAGGTGLGMPITKQLVELHGGEIWLESEYGVGTTFAFTMPYVREIEEAEEVRTGYYA